MKTLQLNKGRESSLLRRHPWIFSGAIKHVDGTPEPGETVKVADAAGRLLGLAAWSPKSQIRARVWSFDGEAQIDVDFMEQKLRQAIERRRPYLDDPERTGCRLIYGESDGLPGLIVDRYGDFLVCQFLFTGVEKWKSEIVEALARLQPCKGIYERSDAAIRRREGLTTSAGVLWGEEPPQSVEVVERGRRYGVNIREGHKTGFYLDQFDNREVVRALAKGRTVLNCFSYTGGFGIAALQGGATHVVNVDSSAPALEQASDNFVLNGFGPELFDNVTTNVFELLREYRQQERRFDLIVLDPPKFAETRAQFSKAARAYKDLALQAASLLTPGGYLVTFSCSGAIDLPLFQKITADGLLDAQRQGQIVRYLNQSEDHPVGLPFPESLYLKGLVVLVD